MPNLKSSKKDLKRITKRTAINKNTKSAVRTAKKQALKLLNNPLHNNSEELTIVIRNFESVAMKAVSKGVYKKSTISRYVARLVFAMKTKFALFNKA